MSFNQQYFLPVSAFPNSNVPRQFEYLSADTLATITAADYFLDTYMALLAGDLIMVFAAGATTPTVVVVTAASVSTVTVSVGGSQTMIVSGAVTPGITELLLNDTTPLIAATIADAKAHQGLFIVKQIDAGTAGHTLTLTSGTLNGTNNVATLNAANEALVVWFDSLGNGTIVENVGSVAIS